MTDGRIEVFIQSALLTLIFIYVHVEVLLTLKMNDHSLCILFCDCYSLQQHVTVPTIEERKRTKTD